MQRELCEWSKPWHLKFNIDKCKKMHVGSGEGDIMNYYMTSEEGERIDRPQITRPCDLDDKLIIIFMGSWAWANPCIKYAFNTTVFPHSLKYILDGLPMKNRR